MKNVSTGEFLRGHVWSIGWGIWSLYHSRHHFFAANDACSISHGSQFLFRCIRIPLVHITSRCLIAVECFQAGDEGPRRDIDISDDVQRQSVEGDYDTEKYEIGRQLE